MNHFWHGFEKQAISVGWLFDRIHSGNKSRVKNIILHHPDPGSVIPGLSEELAGKKLTPELRAELVKKVERSPSFKEFLGELENQNFRGADPDLKTAIKDSTREAKMLPKVKAPPAPSASTAANAAKGSTLLKALKGGGIAAGIGSLGGAMSGGEPDDKGKYKNRHIGAVRGGASAGTTYLTHHLLNTHTPAVKNFISAVKDGHILKTLGYGTGLSAALAGSAVLGHQAAKYFGPKYDREKQTGDGDMK